MMPEGPEVENVRQELLQLVGKIINDIRLTTLSQKYPKYQGQQQNFDKFSQAMIKDILRLGKFLIWKFDNTENIILNHLGMSGKWCFCEDIENLTDTITHPKVIIKMNKPPHAIFDDTRNFGQFKIFHSFEDVMKYPPIKTIGIDGLIIPFPLEKFIKLISNKRYEDKPIGELLLNQRIVAGIGNIYKAESLFHAKIHPLRKVTTLTISERRELGKSISFILQKALNDLGSSFDARYRLPSGSEGSAQRWHKVYQRQGEVCSVCDAIIERIVQKDRSTFYCPKCQV
jgi:formamidopyrimidine-DNA glycosylase